MYSAVHEHASLSPIQKFTHLNANLSSKAANSIEGLPLTESNYTEAIMLLEERFGQPHKIIDAHMQALLDLLSPSNSVTHLRRFYDKLENHIRGLEALGKIKQETYGDLLVPIILAKLPTTIKNNLIRENGTNGSLNNSAKRYWGKYKYLRLGKKQKILTTGPKQSPLPFRPRQHY